MAQTLDHIIDQHEFVKHHQEQVEHRSQKDVFFIWMMIVLLSVIAAHFILNFTPSSSPTGFVTADQDPVSNISFLLGAMMVTFVTILIIGLVYVGITRKDY